MWQIPVTSSILHPSSFVYAVHSPTSTRVPRSMEAISAMTSATELRAERGRLRSGGSPARARWAK